MRRLICVFLTILLMGTMITGLTPLSTPVAYASSQPSVPSIVEPYPLYLTDENVLDPSSQSHYSVTVNGIEVPVHKYRNFSYVQFAFAGEANST